MRKSLVVAAVLFIISAIILTAKAETASAFDPQSLVGEWRGGWSVSPTLKGDLWLEIKSVQDANVIGTVFVSSRARYANRDLPISGKIASDGSLFLSNQYFNLSLTVVTFDEMNGSSTAFDNSNKLFNSTIALKKIK